jgi:ferredoxin
MLQMDQLADLVPDYAERETWVCGPTGLLDAAEEHWAARHIGDRLRTERFRPTIVVAGDGGSIRFGKSDVDVLADAATPILTAGEAAGVLMPSGCRMGICFGCVVPLREGAVRDLRTGELTTAAAGDGVKIQTCISAAAGDCHIDL